MKVYLISDNIDTLTGMRLAGIEGVVVHEAEETKNVIEKAASDRNVGILLITEQLSNLCKETVDRIKMEQKMPLVVIIPDRHGTGRDKDSITRYINESIGLKL